MPVVYQHLRADTKEPFYIGIGKTKSRAYVKSNRSDFWKSISSKYGYIVDILAENVSRKTAIELEMYLINYYGKLYDDTGILCNFTNGGEGGSLGFIQSEETREKKRQANYKREYKTRTHTNYPKEKVSLPVLQFTKDGNFLKEYLSIIEAGRLTNISHSNICQVCKGNRKTAGNYIWKYKDYDKN